MAPITASRVLASFLFILPLASAQEIKLTASDGATGDSFGWSVGISGNTAIVGSYLDDDGGSTVGSAYLFHAGTGQQTAKLLATDGAEDDYFGSSVAISGVTAVVGAYMDDDLGKGSGSAYLFDALTGMQTAKLLPLDGEPNDNFGWSVAISGTRILVGAPLEGVLGSFTGAVYLFDATTGLQVMKLTALDGAPGDFFGRSVAIDGGTAIVGADGDDDSGADAGSAYLFDTSTGLQIAKLLPLDGAPGDFFGRSVAINGNTAIVGAYGDDDLGVFSGSAYLFDTTTGLQTAKLVASDGVLMDSFGISVAVTHTTAIVGSMWDDDVGIDSGSAYVFDTTTGLELGKLHPSDGTFGDSLGYSVASDDGVALIGAPGGDILPGSGTGAAYLLDPASPASWDSREGILGLNPVAYTCSNDPVLGATWFTQVDTAPSVGAITLNTLVVAGLGGPTDGIPAFGHELLILPPFLSFSGMGAHDFPVPTDPTLSGLSQSWQGCRLESSPGGGFHVVLTNALDVVYGL